MTPLEAETFAARLTRIWAPERAGEVPFGWCCSHDDWGHCFTLHLLLYRGVTWEVFHQPNVWLMALAGEYYGQLVGSLHWSSNSPDDLREVMPKGEPRFEAPRTEAFLRKWRDPFRRNCWLSGANTEATMHEKMTWIEGFERAEIESWGLVF